jgi:hypothetical protein
MSRVQVVAYGLWFLDATSPEADIPPSNPVDKLDSSGHAHESHS